MSSASAAPPKTLRIDDVTVVDPLEGRCVPGMSILIRDGRIASVAPVGSNPSEPGTQVIDGRGRWAVPGYNNMHTHALQYGDPVRVMAAMLADGVTGVRQMEGVPRGKRARIDAKLPPSVLVPRVLAVPGDLILPFNGAGTKRVRRTVERQADRGVDFVKYIWTDRDEFFVALSTAHARGLRMAGHLPPSVTIEEAARAGYDCIEHLGTGENIWIACADERARSRAEASARRTPLPRGIRGLPGVGGVFLALMRDRLLRNAAYTPPAAIGRLRILLDGYDERRARALADVFVESGTWHCPTLVNQCVRHVVAGPDDQAHPWISRMSKKEREIFHAGVAAFQALHPDDERTLRMVHERSVQTVRILHEAGVPVLAGTDGSGSNPRLTLHREFRELTEAGMSPIDVLRSTTTVPAKYLGREDRMGRLAEGMDADLLLLHADPTASVDNLAAIELIVRGGHAITRTEAQRMADELTPATGEM